MASQKHAYLSDVVEARAKSIPHEDCLANLRVRASRGLEEEKKLVNPTVLSYKESGAVNALGQLIVITANVTQIFTAIVQTWKLRLWKIRM